MTMTISEEGIEVLKEREGCKLTAYYDSVGVLTVGVGHTSAAGPPEVTPGMTITEEEAEEILDRDLDQYEDAVNDAVTEPMTQCQFDAYVSLCFNIGTGGFKGSTTVREFNEGNVEAAAEAFLLWNTPSEIIPRRQGEYVQFLGGYVPRIKEVE
jgi:lysozyme